MNRCKGRAKSLAKASGYSLAIVFGIVSPKIKVSKVNTAVEIATPLLPNASTKRTEAKEAAPILTILLPIRIQESKSSY